MTFTMGPGDGGGRVCAYPACGRPLPMDAPEGKRYHDSRCRSADWKRRQALGLAPAAGDAENVSKRAVELRELRRHGPVASDRRVQASRARVAVETMLREAGFSEESAAFVARVTIEEAMPERFRS